MNDSRVPGISRRGLLLSGVAAVLFLNAAKAGAVIVKDGAPWKPFDYSPPETLGPGGWYFFSSDEASTVQAIVDCIIPADELSVGGKDAGCAEFIDRQLAGSYGSAERLYMQGPYVDPTPMQGDQFELSPRQRYRTGLAALDKLCRAKFQKPFAQIPSDRQVEILSAMEKGELQLEGIPPKIFFASLLQNTMEGFFADPIYGGNKDMVSWKMLGFPGARYDYRDFVEIHNQKLDLQPLSIAGRPNWKARG